MNFGNILQASLYVLLLLPAIIFVNQTIQEFLRGAATYSEKQEPITLNDLPTIAICLDFGNNSLTYGVNISIAATLIGDQNTTVTLLENKNISTLHGIYLHRSKLLRQKSI